MQILDSFIDGGMELDDGDRQEYFYALVMYMQTGEVPDGIGCVARAMIVSNKPSLDKSRNRANAGSSGGSASKSDADEEANAKQTASKREANEEANAKQTVKQNESKAASKREANRNRNRNRKEELGEEGEAKASLSGRPDSARSEVDEIVGYLNERAGTQYRASTGKTRQLIGARLKEGFSTEDFRTVIDTMCAAWKGGDMARFLRPETLFGTKFESYLNWNFAAGGSSYAMFGKADSTISSEKGIEAYDS